MLFSASLDRLAKGITIATTILFAFLLVLYVSSFDSGNFHIALIVFPVVIMATYAGSYLFRITAYELTNDQLIIHRPFKNKIIELSEIHKAELLPKEALKWTIRTFGNGGLFGFYGKFSNTKLGGMTWYATRRNNMLLLRMKDGKKIVITPDETQQFIETLTVNILRYKKAETTHLS